MRHSFLTAVALAASAAAAEAQPRVIDLGHGMFEAIGVAVGTGGDRTAAVPASNTFLITTSDGNVVVDTSLAAAAIAHQQALTARNDAPIKAIILTHAHGDHTGGVAVWRGPGTAIVAQQNHEAFVRYQRRLAGFFAQRNA